MTRQSPVRRRVVGHLAVRVVGHLAVMVAVAVVLGVVGAAGLVATSPSPAAAQAPTRSFGTLPLDDVIAAAKANTTNRPGCPLTADRLAAMMLAPVYPETGAINSRSATPGPMTLGRWDTQASLYAFGNPSTEFRRAFWQPGVGMWQFDSAGFWNLTTAQAISSNNSANAAAKVMADRFCASTAANVTDRMRFAWSPWYGCATGASVCISVFNELFVNNTFTNVVRDPSVGRLGGMVARTCRIGGASEVPCHRVDPAAAQGYSAWTLPAAGPTPVSAPFYNYAVGDIEFRYWAAADTGYTVGVLAFKRITANARTGLTWQTATPATALCDVTAGVGDCGTPRVASTPWGDFSADPFGSVDAASAGANALTVAGWAIDPDTTAPIEVHVYVDDAWGGAVTANANRPDVGAAVPGYGNNHGFSLRVANLAAGDRRVCAFAINVGPWGTSNPGLGCRTVGVSASPQGRVDVARLAPGGAQLVGWAADPDSTATVQLEFTVDGAVASSGSASRTRSDVGTAYPWFGAERGFNTIVPLAVTAGTRRVCVNAVDLPTTDRVALGCSNVVVPSGNPLGSVDAATAVTDGITVQGWALDWTSADPVEVTVVLDGVVTPTTTTASRPRADVRAVYPGFDDRRGFEVNVPAVRGPHVVCVTARGRTLGCGDVMVTDGNFADVSPASAAAVSSRWMADTGITRGFPTDWLFSPALGLNRTQAATFLWRFMGSPPSPTSCGWNDVAPGAPVAQAACWARATGVITGVSGDAARFDPQGPVTRAQMAGMLWRTAGQPGVAGQSRFTDVGDNAWFADAAAWADVHGISTGVAGTDRFDPGGPVTRGQMATFLWRLAGTDAAWAVGRPASAVRK